MDTIKQQRDFLKAYRWDKFAGEQTPQRRNEPVPPIQKPYPDDTELIDLVADIKITIPRYCRVNRVIRDIPSTNVVEGNKRTSLRQDIQAEMEKRGTQCNCVRCREVRDQSVEDHDLEVNDLVYQAGEVEEHFISYDTGNDNLAGFLRLSLPGVNAPETGLQDLQGAAIIREVHVYGQSLEVGIRQQGILQHAGLGTTLLEMAEKLARARGYQRLAVISAVGTRQYYRKRGYKRGESYLIKELA